ncbi:hypothetical protein C2S52_018266 [Perilla frutescens var. hirtella]|nr:hypothetical protein C2S52_018266 [Perilla frutescens var. hirtella]
MKNSVEGLKNLYSGIDDLLLLPHIQQIISQESQDQKWADQVLDGYIRLLDACSTAKDLISNTKHGIQELLSALRRKDADGIRCYLNSRRRSKKNIQKSLRSFTSKPILSTLEKDSETSDLVCKLNEAESITLGRLESLLSYLIGARNVEAKQSRWSLVAKLMHSKKGGDACWNEFEKMDGLLQMSLEGVQDDEVVNLSKEVDSSIQNLEEEIECLFRQLIRTRVFLLNILNH